MRRPSLALAIALSGCFYSPDSYQFMGPFPGHRVALECLYVAVTLTEDARAAQPVVQYSFGNHCTRSTIVDLGAVRAIGRYDDGTDRELHAYDPRRELRPVQIDPWWAGGEEIMYVADSGPRPSVVCVDVGAVERVTPPRSRWVCMGAAEGGVQ
jgi:hypothetical protein